MSPPYELNPETARHLGVLHGAGDEAVEATIALLPLGERMELAAHNLIGTHVDGSSGIRLTHEGRAAIVDCAAWLAREPGGAGTVLTRSPDELEEALHHLAASALGMSRDDLADEVGNIIEKARQHRGVAAS
jgi:hypothetical protein